MKNNFINLFFAPLSHSDNGLNGIKHFYTVDLLRGISAIVILFWHYHHFYWTQTTGLDIDKSRQPFYDYFEIFFTNGYWVVQLFWLVSGLYYPREIKQLFLKFNS